MSHLSYALPVEQEKQTSTMKALVFYGPEKIALESVPIPRAGVGEVVIRVTLTTICGTDLHILKGEYPVKPGLIIGHEPVGYVYEIGEGVTGYQVGDRVLVGAITPCGQCNFCLSGNWSQCGGPLGGWKFGNTINGAQAQYLRVPHAQANLAKIPDELTDAQVVLLADIASTGISAAESADLQIGDSVAVFAQGPIGLCATAGAKLKGASLIIAVESDPVRAEMARRMGADVVLDTVGGSAFCQSFGAVRLYGRLATLLSTACELPQINKARLRNIVVGYEQMTMPLLLGNHDLRCAQTRILERGAKLFDEGKLKVEVSSVLPLGQAPAAHKQVEDGHTTGKVVLQVE